MKQLRVAIIGQGRSGRNIHGKHLLTDTERFKVVAVVDAIEGRRERALKEYEGCDVYADYKELFGRDDIDFVVNSTFSHFHYPITKDLMEHGFNVLSEKPFCRTAAEVDDLIATSERTGKMLAIFQQSRFAPYFVQVKKVIESGVLGRLVQVSIQFNGFARRWDWQTIQAWNAGGLYNTGPHPLDQALNILDMYDDMPNVFCKMDSCNVAGDAEDYTKLILTAPNKPLIDLEVCSQDAYPLFTYKIMGTNGSLKGSMNHIDWKYFKPEEAPKHELVKGALMDSEGMPIYCGESLKWYEDSWSVDPKDPGTFTVATRTLYTTVYEHLVEGKPLVVTPKQVRQQIAIIDECHRQNPLPVTVEK